MTYGPAGRPVGPSTDLKANSTRSSLECSMVIQGVLLSVGGDMGLHPCIAQVGFESSYGRFRFVKMTHVMNVLASKWICYEDFRSLVRRVTSRGYDHLKCSCYKDLGRKELDQFRKVEVHSRAWIKEKRGERRRKVKIRQERSSLVVDFAKDSNLRGMRDESILVYIEGIVDSKCLGKEPTQNREFRVGKRRRKVGVHLDRGLERRPSQSPKKGLRRLGSGELHQPERPTPTL
uniref:Uncharacterized protein n=1 Tax=Solanum tuberosum TaxID=4113 RepID=M1DUU5_SOLTU